MTITLKHNQKREAFNKAFFNQVRETLFRGVLSQGQVDNMNIILDAFELYGNGQPKALAYVLATVRHEVGAKLQPVREGFADSDAEARRAVAGRKYGVPVGPYNHVYYGRGYVQLTWHRNYINSSKDAGVDLARYPDKMLDPAIAAKITVLGILDGRFNAKGKGISQYLPETGEDDLKGARETVNLHDRWQLIGEYYKEFLKAVLLGHKAANEASPVPAPAPRPETPVDVHTMDIRELAAAILAGNERLAETMQVLVDRLDRMDGNSLPPINQITSTAQKENPMGNVFIYFLTKFMSGQQLAGIARHVLTAIGGWFVGQGFATQEVVNLWVGSAVIVVAYIWAMFFGGKEQLSKEQFASFIRHSLTILAGYITAINPQLGAVVGQAIPAILAAAGVVWSYFSDEKIKEKA